MQVNDRELAVEVEGHGPAVLMVHGLGGTSNVYQVQAEALAERFRVIRLDSAGAGRSDVADGISITTHADDLVAVLDALDVDAATVVGHSMGTLVVRELAARHPDRVSALALLGAVPVPGEAGREPSATAPPPCGRRAPPRWPRRSLRTRSRPPRAATSRR